MINPSLRVLLACFMLFPFYSFSQQSPDVYKSQAEQAIKSKSGFDLGGNKSLSDLNKKLKSVKVEPSPQSKEVENILKNSVLKAQKEYGISK